MPSSGYTVITFVADELLTSTKMNQMGANDAAFNNGNGFNDSIILNRHLTTGMPVQIAGMVTGAVATGTTVMPFDDTIPQNTEGDQYMSFAFTPKSSTNKLLILVKAWFSHSAANTQAGVALFQDSVANAIAVSEHYENTGTAVVESNINHIMTAGTTSAITFKVRIGSQNAGTLTFNGQSGSRRFGGVANSGITVIEYKA